jgi:hypothetical protein
MPCAVLLTSQAGAQNNAMTQMQSEKGQPMHQQQQYAYAT